MKLTLKLSELVECPLCGHDEFIMKGKVSGTVSYRQKFNGCASTHNTRMYDELKVEYRSVYCASCGAYLGNHKTNECSKKVKAAFGVYNLV